LADQEFKFLAIKNWDKYQSDDKGRVRGGSSPWVKDWTDKESDDGYMALTVFQRYILDGCRRLRGKFGKNIPNDPMYVARALHIGRTDRPHVRHAVSTLTVRGFLLLSNQQLDFTDKDIDKEEDIDKERSKPSARKTRGKKVIDPRYQPFLEVLHRYWKKFGEKLRFELWFGDPGGSQLKNLLKRHKAMTAEEFYQCVANRARSPGVKHEEPFYLWAGHILEWVAGPKGLNGNGNGQINKADQRERQRDAGWADTLRKRNGTGGVSEGGGSGLRPELERGAPGIIPGPIGPAREILSPRDHPRVRGSTD